MSQKDHIYCSVSQTGKQETFIKMPCSPLYVSDKVNTLGDSSLKSLGNGSLNDILHLEKKLFNKGKSTLQKLNIDLKKVNIDLKSKIYEPLLLPVNYNEKHGVNNEDHKGLLHNCTLSCFAERNGYSAMASIPLELLAITSALIPKSLVEALDILEKAPIMGKQTESSASRFTSVFSILEKKYPKLKIPFEPFFRKMPFPYQARSLHSPTLRFKLPNKSNPIPLTRLLRSKTLFVFAGRIIPLFGWGLLAKDIEGLAMCANKCSNIE